MKDAPTIGRLVDAVGEHMELAWVAGRKGASRDLAPPTVHTAEHHLVGPLNFVHPNRVQLIGAAEMGYLNGLGREARSEALSRLYLNRPVAVVLTEGARAPMDLVEAANTHATPLLATEHPDRQALEQLQYYLSQFLAERTVLHGVFMEVLGMGVLLTGDPAVGKSELALELITRGHRLVADDAPEFARIAPDIINGTCPPMLRDFLEVRGLGLLNVRAIFGESAIKTDKSLRLVIHLETADEHGFKGMERLTGSLSSRQVLGLDITQVSIPVAPGRNMAILIETAVRVHMLRLKGYDASEDFIERQQIVLQDN